MRTPIGFLEVKGLCTIFIPRVAISILEKSMEVLGSMTNISLGEHRSESFFLQTTKGIRPLSI